MVVILTPRLLDFSQLFVAYRFKRMRFQTPKLNALKLESR